jgi:peptide/nickel transport system substrate-binding protein
MGHPAGPLQQRQLPDELVLVFVAARPGAGYEQFSGPKAKQPRKVWDDPYAQKLIDQSFVESDPKKRQFLFDQLHTTMLEKTPLIVFYNITDSWAVRKRVTGFSVWEGKPLLWNAKIAAK